MELSSEQCTIIAYTVPVLLVAIVVESRSGRRQPPSAYATGVIIAAAIAFFVALWGVESQLSTFNSGTLLVLFGSLWIHLVLSAKIALFVKP